VRYFRLRAIVEAGHCHYSTGGFFLAMSHMKLGLHRSKLAWIALPYGVLFSFVAFASNAQEERPAYLIMRQDEDWRSFRAPDPPQAWDDIKHIELGEEPGRILSFGGDARIRYEYLGNPSFGRGVTDHNGYGLQRYLMHADFHWNQSLRLFTQLQHSKESGREGGPRGFDENEADLHQLFLEIGRDEGPRDFTFLRLGRQELEFGPARLMSVRDGRNTRISFQGARFVNQDAKYRHAAWLLRPVRIEPKAFDDSWDTGQRVAGAGITRYDIFNPDGAWVVYYTRFDEAQARFEQAAAQEVRHTLGSRISGRAASWDYNYEAAYQFGDFGNTRIRAWDVASDTGYTLADTLWRPRLGLRIDFTSGDRDLADDELNNFNPLFASTAYSGLAGLIGPSNAIDVAPSVTLRPTSELSLTLGVAYFWRQSPKDGIYDLDLNLIRTGTLSSARHIGRQSTMILNWQLGRHTSFSSTLSYFAAGKFLEETPPASDVTYFTTWWNYRF
jgi:Alginate export